MQRPYDLHVALSLGSAVLTIIVGLSVWGF
jgi:hypothetical protein